MRAEHGLNAEALAVIAEAVKAAGYELGKDHTAWTAASEFYKDGKYVLRLWRRQQSVHLRRIHPLLEELTKQYPIVSIEDGLDESDWDGFAYQTKYWATKSAGW